MKLLRFGIQLLIGSALVATTPAFAQKETPPLAQLKAAAEKGDAQAQAQLGDAYRGKFDSNNALVWYRKAAQQGVVRAQSEAGRILMGYAQSFNAKPDVKSEHADEGIQWLLKAANQNDRAAQLELGRQYQSGKFIKQDAVEAYKWFSLAAGNNPFNSKELESKWARDALILKMTQEQIAEGQRRVAAFTPGKPSASDLPEPAWVKMIKLQGISGAENRRLAIINHYTFQKGDEAEIRAGPKKITVRCLDVGVDSARIAIEELNREVELKLPVAAPDQAPEGKR